MDGVNESPTWTFDYPSDPKMGEAIGAATRDSQAILLGRNTKLTLAKTEAYDSGVVLLRYQAGG